VFNNSLNGRKATCDLTSSGNKDSAGSLKHNQSTNLLRQISNERPVSYRYDKRVASIKRAVSCYLDDESGDSARISEVNVAYVQEKFRLKNTYTPLIAGMGLGGY
jgi:hypothetical protein